MSAFAFAEGLLIGYEMFSMARIEAKVSNLEKTMDSVKEQVKDMRAEFHAVKSSVEELSNFHHRSLMDKAYHLLGKHQKANVQNAEAVALLVSSLGAIISAITFTGKKKHATQGGVLELRGFIAGTQSVERIFYGLGKIGELSSLSAGKIVTSCVSSPQEMKATGVAITAFYKLLQIFGLRTCPMTDEHSKRNVVTVRFEGNFTLAKYATYSQELQRRVQVIRGKRKNVYILGGNGHGKSSWGNLISGAKLFEVGCNIHTTMIPESCDVESGLGFRIWDTPGLFDGSEQHALMENHLSSVITANGYCSAVLFVFCGTIPANDITRQVLEYAERTLGEQVKDNFCAIVNDMGATGMAESRKETYIEMLYEHGYNTSGDNVFVASAENDIAGIRTIVRTKLAAYSPRLIHQFQLKYDRIVNRVGGLPRAIHEAHLSSKKELTDILKRGKIETLWYRPDGPRQNLSIKPDVIIFRQNSKGYFFRKFNIGNNRVVEEKSIRMKGSARFKTTVRAQLNQEYQIGQVGIFLRTILNNERTLLIHTPNGKCDYELRDASDVGDEKVREEVIEALIDEPELYQL